MKVARTPNGIPMSDHNLIEMTAEVAEWIKAKGWDDDRTFGDELILIASELVEALEAFRTNGFDEWRTFQPTVRGVKLPKMTPTQCEAAGLWNEETKATARREGVAAELAGTLVRLLDTCDRHNIDLGNEFRKEMDYNWTRSIRHGGKAL